MSEAEEGGADSHGANLNASAQAKPVVKQEGKKEEPINLTVKDQNNEVVHFKVKPSVKLERVFKAYCVKKNLDIGSIRFLWDGTRLKGHETPVELGMEDDDSIDAVIEQTGGQ